MKIIHTADWHLGQTFYNYNRYKEHAVFLDWLCCTIKERGTDVLLIAGDVFDNPNPSAEAQKMYYNFLRRVTGENEDLKIVIIAGNHDSAARIEAPSPLLDFFNVHVNFWPVDGKVTYYKYHPGRYMLAYLPKASELNEHTSVSLKSPYGEVFFKQLAGTFARRIVCYAEPGNHEIKGNECGIIKFGSRIDMYLPLDAEIKVKLGDVVTGCESVIAELKK